MATAMRTGRWDRWPVAAVAVAAGAAWLAGCGSMAEMGRTPATPGPVVQPVAFFGLADSAESVAYVIDASGSGSDAYPYLQAALLRSISGLAPSQRFAVVLFGAVSPDVLKFQDKAVLAAADDANRNLARQFVLLRREEGPADEGAPRRAMQAAFELGGGPPQVVFLVAERPWAEGLVERIAELNPPVGPAVGARRRVRIHAVGFVNPEVQPLLRRIAGDNGGRFRFIDAVNLGKEQ